MSLAMSLEIIPTDAAAGAEVRGINLAEPIGDNLFPALDQALSEYGVLCFRGQTLTPEQQMAATSYFGELAFNTFGQSHGLDGNPAIVVLSNVERNGKGVGVKGAGHKWHTDMCYTAKPPRGTVLYALEVPSQNGLPLGDTCFAATHAAYDALPDTMKQRLKGVRGRFDFAGRERNVPITQEQIDAFPPVTHPIVRTHPVTGRKCLYIMRDDCTGIEGLAQDEADQLIAALSDHIVRPEFVYRHQWQEGDFVMWDNCIVQHMAIQDYDLPHRRLIHRTTFEATEVPT